jgi:hypothetical protein
MSLSNQKVQAGTKIKITLPHQGLVRASTMVGAAIDRPCMD